MKAYILRKTVFLLCLLVAVPQMATVWANSPNAERDQPIVAVFNLFTQAEVDKIREKYKFNIIGEFDQSKDENLLLAGLTYPVKLEFFRVTKTFYGQNYELRMAKEPFATIVLKENDAYVLGVVIHETGGIKASTPNGGSYYWVIDRVVPGEVTYPDEGFAYHKI